ncbi:hypothetical protein GCM10027062_42440 [Nocardioides hungaricus]
MRDILHGVALAVVLFVAACATLVQLSDATSAIDRLQRDGTVVQQVSSQR